jgi:hypothetical protein
MGEDQRTRGPEGQRALGLMVSASVEYTRRFTDGISARFDLGRPSRALWPSGLLPIESFSGADQGPEPIGGRTSAHALIPMMVVSTSMARMGL